jgi:hypothetical protein
MKQNHENKSLNIEPSENEQRETKQRGGNHNPEGANQYTSGRVDDRGRKEEQKTAEETKEVREEDQNENA